jgi:hypothetical protein
MSDQSQFGGVAVQDEEPQTQPAVSQFGGVPVSEGQPTEEPYSVASGAIIGAVPGVAIEAKHLAPKALRTGVDFARQAFGINPNAPQPGTFTPPPQQQGPITGVGQTVVSEHGFHPGATTNAEFNVQQRQANELMGEPAPAGFEVEGNRRILTPINHAEKAAREKEQAAAFEEMRIKQEAEQRARDYIAQKEAERAAMETKPRPITERVGKVAGSPIARGSVIGFNAVDAYNRAQEPGWRNKVAAGLNAAAAAASALPSGVKKIPVIGKYEPYVAPALTGLAHFVAEPEVEHKAEGGSAISHAYDVAKSAVNVPLKYAAKAFNPALMGYLAYESGKEAKNRYEHGDKVGAALSGLSALGTGASAFPPAATIGVPVSMGADAVNYLRDNPNVIPDYVKTVDPSNPMLSTGGEVKKFQSGGVALAEKAAELTLPYIKSFLKSKGPEAALAEALAKNPVNIPAEAHKQIGNYNALPLNLPRAKPKTDQEIQDIAARVAKQMTGEHVTSGRAGDTTNLAGRSMRESNRVKGLDYTVEPTGTVADPVVFHPKSGDIMLGYPGDQTISDQILKSIGENEIGSLQTGGGQYGLGQRHLPEGSKWWNSEKSIANMIQNKGTDLTLLPGADPNRIFGEHMGMGRVANNFAQHMADANLKAIDISKMDPEHVEGFNSLIREGWSKPNPKKTGERIYYKFPEFPGIENPNEAYMAMLQNPELRKFFNAKMKTPSVTSSFNMPNGLDVEWAVTEPQLRNMEVGMTGLSTGRLTPFAKTAADPTYPMYGTSIPGVAIGHSDVLKPVEIAFPDATQHILATQRPQDFTGTIQKVFPHQIVDDQYLNEYGQYRDLIKKYTGQKAGGKVQHFADGKLAVAKAALKMAEPLVSRLEMGYKDVTKRIPELQESAKRILEGTGSREEHEALVNVHKPVVPYSFVPQPATREEAVNALTSDKKDLYGVPSQTLEAGHPVGLRLDIPSYTNHGVWVPTVHEQASGFGAGKSIGHESVASVLNPQFGMSEKAAASIASGKPKGTIATIKGEWNPVDQEQAVASAQEYLNHPDWRQVGMDPERHSYFYDRETMEPITHAEEALQIGPLVLAKKPVYGNKEDFKYAKGGKAKKKKR